MRSTLVLGLLLAACSKPAQEAPPREAAAPPAATTASPSSGEPPAPDTHCTKDADCTVKDVGSCCGYSPACLNVAAKTDPEAVKARCTEEQKFAICGFQEIAGCTCVAGRCQAQHGEAAPQ